VLEARNLLSTYAVNHLADPPSTGSMYWTSIGSNDIRRANLDGSGQQTLVTGQNGPERIALDLAVGQMYWTDYFDHDIRRANLDGSGQQTLVSGLGTSPTGIALDVAGGHMYWTGGTFGSGDIHRANLDGSGQQTLVPGQSGPIGIALDLASGQMYWTDYVDGGIRRANLDGSGRQTLVSGQIGPNGIALDLAAGQMYWIDENVSDIRRSNLDGSGQQTLVTGLNVSFGIALQLEPAPTVTCSVADPLLWPPNHALVNVGLSVNVDPPDATLHVSVYADDNASPSDASDIAPDTLRLRAERQGSGDGRVYLIVTTATDAAGTSFDVCTVAVPHNQSAESIAAVQQQAADAEAYYRQFQTAPPGFDLLGEGSPVDGTPHPHVSIGQVNAFSNDNGLPLATDAAATVLSAPKPPLNQTTSASDQQSVNLPADWAAPSVDANSTGKKGRNRRYFAFYLSCEIRMVRPGARPQELYALPVPSTNWPGIKNHVSAMCKRLSQTQRRGSVTAFQGFATDVTCHASRTVVRAQAPTTVGNGARLFEERPGQKP
jgi:hypothetical protein